MKIHCSVLAEDAIKAAIADWKRKNAAASQPQTQAPPAQEHQPVRLGVGIRKT